ncbi:hypothetical protein WJX84_012436 [Apatococcus fuscideae]|uniref:AB hydrolase-1 domain-containing protein n=1 Tax=Apatococcus fuscideae TaxID=2026836 RepID=A0AAW1RUX9_9CHLO
MAEASASKKRKVQADVVQPQLQASSRFSVPGLTLQEYSIKAPLDHHSENSQEIDIFFRVVEGTSKLHCKQPFLLYLQGGPGFEAPRPTEASGWLRAAINSFKIVLLDQRGTGRSTPVTAASLARIGNSEEQAAYLQHFRADSIVQDAELVRQQLVPQDMQEGRWAILGQSFGGFCCVQYLSAAPQGLTEVFLTGGLPPDVNQPCAAESAYRALYKRVLLQNAKYYARFPQDIALVQRIVHYLDQQPDGGAKLSNGSILRPRTFQMLGLQGLGSSGGFERLHYLLETAFDGPDLSMAFLKGFETWMPWAANPIYALLHESIYCQRTASNWAADRIRQAEFSQAFDAKSSADNSLPVNFTGQSC